jgi:hypothetical protein
MNMLPRSKGADLPNHFPGDAESTSKDGTALGRSSDHANVFFSQFCAPIMTTFALVAPPLCFAINGIVQIGPKKQMVRIYTWRVVAGMKDKKPLGNSAPMKYPTRTVGVHSATPIPEHAVTLSAFSGSPQPTTIFSLRDFCEEALARKRAIWDFLLSHRVLPKGRWSGAPLALAGAAAFRHFASTEASCHACC